MSRILSLVPAVIVVMVAGLTGSAQQPADLIGTCTLASMQEGGDGETIGGAKRTGPARVRPLFLNRSRPFCRSCDRGSHHGARGLTRSVWERIPNVDHLSDGYRQVIGFWEHVVFRPTYSQPGDQAATEVTLKRLSGKEMLGR